MQSFYNGKKVLITGHTGFKGGWLTRVLTKWGARVVGVSLPAHTEPNIFTVVGLKNTLTNYEADITDDVAMVDIFKKEQPEIVFHLAAQALVRDSYDNPELTHKTNILGTAHILKAIRVVPSVQAAVIITTDKVYHNDEQGKPYKETDPLGGHDPYSASKAAADLITASYIHSFFHPEKYGLKHKTLIASARSGNVFGGGDWSKDRLIPDIVRAVYHDNAPVIIRNPQAIRPWQHVLEPIAGYLQLAKKLHEGDVSSGGAWNFGPHDELSCTVEEMVKQALITLNKGAYVLVPDVSKSEAGLLRLDSSKARAQLGWESKLDLITSLKWTFDWYRRHYEDNSALEEMDRQIEDYFSPHLTVSVTKTISQA